MMRRIIFPFIFISLGVCAFGQDKPLATKSSMPAGWSITGDNPGGYDFALDKTVKHGGAASLMMSAKATADKDKFGGLIQSIRADDYHGKRVMFSGFMRTANVGGRGSLWVRVDGPNMEMLDFSNMDSRPVSGTTDWVKYDLVVDVPTNAEAVIFGSFLSGATGQMWVDDFKLEIVGKDVGKTSNPVSEQDRQESEEYRKQVGKDEIAKIIALYRSKPEQPMNLDFEQAAALSAKPKAP